MGHIAGVHIVSRNSSRRVDAAGYGALAATAARARNIEGGNFTPLAAHEVVIVAALGAYEAVIDAAGVHGIYLNVSSRIDVPGVSTLVGASTRTRNVHIDDIAVISAQEAVRHIAFVEVFTCLAIFSPGRCL